MNLLVKTFNIYKLEYKFAYIEGFNRCNKFADNEGFDFGTSSLHILKVLT